MYTVEPLAALMGCCADAGMRYPWGAFPELVYAHSR